MFDTVFQFSNTVLYAFVAWLMAYAAFTSQRLAPFYGCVSFHFFVVVARSAILVLNPDLSFGWRYVHFVTIGLAVMAGIYSYLQMHRRLYDRG